MSNPKELVVISGKGGTGKTSLTASLAHCFPKKILADCDVDAADLHLLFHIDSYQMKAFSGGHEAVIQHEKCNQCGECLNVCRFDAIELRDGQIQIHGCEGCRVCVDMCPSQAIHWVDAKNGIWKESQTEQGTLFHAQLYPGSENSGKLVSHVRTMARQAAIAQQVPWVIIDGPPGIGCPVIASITGASAVLAVTEPTPSGVHDLDRVLALAQHFKIPAFIVINKWDLNAQMVEKIEMCSQNRKAPVLARIPYSPLFTQAQLQRKSVIEVFPNSEESLIIRKLSIDLQQLMK